MENISWLTAYCDKIDVSRKEIDQYTSDRELHDFSMKAIISFLKDIETNSLTSVHTSVPEVDAATGVEKIKKISRGAKKRQQRKKSKSDDMLTKSEEPLASTHDSPVISLLVKDGDEKSSTHTVISSMENADYWNEDRVMSRAVTRA